jgi:hypothetical protein
MAKKTAKTTLKTLDKVVECYKNNFGNVDAKGIVTNKKIGNDKIKRHCKLSETISKHKLDDVHFELVETGAGEFQIHFHLENGNGKVIESIEILMKNWVKNLKIFNKTVLLYPHPEKYKCWIYIKPADSYGAEKICIYIKEFIYQIKSRVVFMKK